MKNAAAERQSGCRSTEDAEQEAVVEYCSLLHIPVVHIPNEGKRSAAYGARLKRMGMCRGFPDLFIPLARGGYHGLFIEMKSGRGRVTGEQEAWISLLNANGYRAIVCRGAAVALPAIKSYLGGVRK